MGTGKPNKCSARSAKVLACRVIIPALAYMAKYVMENTVSLSLEFNIILVLRTIIKHDQNR